MSEPKRFRLKFLFGVIIIIAIFTILPQVFVKLGWLPPLINKSWLVILIAGGGILFKALIGDMVSGDFTFHKFGYDNCIITFGGVLTAFVLQLKGNIDYFPGLSLSPMRYFDSIGSNIIQSRQIELFILLFISLILLLFAANNSQIVIKDESKVKWLLSILNSFVGVIAVGSYLYILILKG